ncbi:MAG: hypothetical protein HQ557_07370 [Bacteroidetes bacterium]|nr:hypothetical protein [Bacteroidota bacterium]
MFNRYTESGKWFKGNTHIHTICSDGGKSPSEVSSLYHHAGYDFIAITDHWQDFTSSYPTPTGMKQSTFSRQVENSKILILNGIEIDGRDLHGQYYHVVALGTFEQIQPSMNLKQTIATLINQDAYLILAHPYWCGNSFEDVYRFPFHAVEIYNHVCDWLNGKGSAGPYWDMALREGISVFGIAADDSHFLPEHPGWNGGWIMVQAPELTTDSIYKSLHQGSFYSTTGPEFHQIIVEDGLVHCTTSPIQRALLIGKDTIGDRICAPDNETITEFSFPISSGSNFAQSPYLRLEIEDGKGKRAWSNSLNE